MTPDERAQRAKGLFQLAAEANRKAEKAHYHNGVLSCLLDGVLMSVTDAREQLIKGTAPVALKPSPPATTAPQKAEPPVAHAKAAKPKREQASLL